MISRIHRFHGPSSLNFVYRRGQTVRGQYNTLRYIRNERISTYRVAVVVSRKVSKSAVVRNRIRRRLYALMQELGAGIQGGYDLVFILHDEAMRTLPSSAMQATIASQLAKAGLVAQHGARAQRSDGTIKAKEATK